MNACYIIVVRSELPRITNRLAIGLKGPVSLVTPYTPPHPPLNLRALLTHIM